MYSLQDLNWAPGQPDNVYGGAQDFLYSLENLFFVSLRSIVAS